MANNAVKNEIVFESRGMEITAKPRGGAEVPIVKGVDFHVRRGEVVALIGESGSGKTTLALSALGYCKPGLHVTGGGAYLLGKNMTKMRTAELRHHRGTDVAYLAQSAAATFNPAIRIGDQVVEAPIISGMDEDAVHAKALQLYRDFDLPENIGERYPHQVSGGQLQRLMAAMALCGEPDLLVLDEPTTALDVTTQIEVLKAFKKVIKQEGTAAIYISHDLAVVAQIADHIIVLYNGEVQEAGPVHAIINKPRHPYTKKLMAAIEPLPRMHKRKKITRKKSAKQKQDIILAAEAVDAGYGAKPGKMPKQIILHEVSTAVPRGKTLGVIGESGCGKSTLARVLAGLLHPAQGKVLLDGEEIAGSYAERRRDVLQKIQFVYQNADTALNPRQRIGDILGRPLEFYLGMQGRAKEKRIDELLDMVELHDAFATRRPHELSGGQKQRVNLARALAAEPEIVLCDEVTSALDKIVAANVMALLKNLRARLGVSFVFISHDISTISSFADDIAVLDAGRIVEQGDTYDVLRTPEHAYTRLLMESVPELRRGWLEEVIAKRERAAQPR